MTRDDVVGFGKEFVKQFQEDDASGMAAELAYRWLFAVFPFGLFLAALGAFIASWIGIQNPGQQIIDALGDNLPAELAAGVAPELERVIGQQQPGLVSIGALLALWAATSGTMTVIKAMNRAYDVEETRSAVTRYGIGIGLTIGAAVVLILSFVTIVGGLIPVHIDSVFPADVRLSEYEKHIIRAHRRRSRKVKNLPRKMRQVRRSILKRTHMLELRTDKDNADRKRGLAVWDMGAALLNSIALAVDTVIPEGLQVYWVFTVDEEYNSAGAIKLMDEWPEWPYVDLRALFGDRPGQAY